MSWQSPDIKVVSFDVFDTVVTRNLHSPKGIFERVQARLIQSRLPDLHPEDCSRLPGWRISAERRARCAAQAIGAEITHSEIFDLLVRQADLTEKMSPLLAAYEIDEELKSVIPVGPVVSLITEMREAGKKIVFISDMYLPDQVIKALLAKVGAWQAGDRLYVSGSIGCKKSSGQLFRHVLDDLGIKPNQMIHYGDYLWSDFLVPRWKHGIQSLAVRTARANCYESLWGDPCHCLYCSSISGASRAARVAHPVVAKPSAETTLYNLGCNVAGPMLTAFILWTLHRAVEAGIKRLYFLSRDGEIMLDVARDLAKRCGIEIELRYLYVSRTAVFPALLGTGVNSQTIGWLKEDNIVLTARIISDRLKLDAECLYGLLIQAGAILNGLNAPLDSKTVESISGLLVTDPALKKMLAVRGREILQNLAEYLEQEGLFDGTSSALVDLGWRGTTQDVFHTCFAQRFGTAGLSGFYFGVDHAGEANNWKYGYFFSHGECSEINRYRHLFRVMLELMCSGSHGMVFSHYSDARGRYTPVFGAVEHPGNWDRIRHLRKGVTAFLHNLDSSCLEGSGFEHVRPHVLSVLKKLFFYPTGNESVALGDLLFSADQAGHGVYRVAPPFTVVSAMYYLTKRSYADRSTLSSWFFASWSRSGNNTQLVLYPVVMLLRICYVGVDMWRFGMLRTVDFVNKLISVNTTASSGDDNVVQ